MHLRGVELGGIAGIPRGMGVDAADEEAERLRRVATHELADAVGCGNGRMGHRAAHSKARNLLEGEHFQLLCWMVLPCPSDTIAEVGHIMYHAAQAPIDGLVVSEGTMMLRIQPGIKGCPDGDTHCHRTEIVGEQHALLGQAVYVGRSQILPSIASYLVGTQIVGYEHQDIWPRLGLPRTDGRADQSGNQ